jgi:hypothetical protein
MEFEVDFCGVLVTVQNDGFREGREFQARVGDVTGFGSSIEEACEQCLEAYRKEVV